MVTAIDAALASKGWTRVAEGQADIVLVGNVATREKQTIETFYGGPHWNGWDCLSRHPDHDLYGRHVRPGHVRHQRHAGSLARVGRGLDSGLAAKVTKAVQSAVARMFESFPPDAPPR